MRRIKNYQGMSKEKLTIALLKSKRNIAELSNNNLDNDKISDVKKILNRLRDILPKIYKKETKKKLYEIERNENLSEQEKEEIEEYLTKLVRNLKKKEEHRHHDCDDPDYYGLRDIERLFRKIDDYYKPILVKSPFRGNYKHYECRGHGDKNLFAEQYLEKIKPYLRVLINDNKTIESGDSKIQLIMHINSICSKGIGKIRNVNIFRDNEEIMQRNKTNDIIESLLSNYCEEEQIVRGASDFVFESAELLDSKLHKIKLKRRRSYIKSPRWIRNKAATINPKNEDDVIVSSIL